MEKIIKEINIYEYMPVLIDLINEGKDVNILITGSSMSPFLKHKRDSIIVSKPDGYFHKGQMVFYKRSNGQYVMHRIHHIKDDMLYVVGDNQTIIEGPLSKNLVFGVIHSVIRKDTVINKKHLLWQFYEKIWIIIPIRRILLKLYLLIK